LKTCCPYRVFIPSLFFSFEFCVFRQYIVDFSDADVSGGEEEEGEKQVTVKFARQESDRVKKAREQSYNFLSKRSAEEKWYQTQYHPSDSRMAEVSGISPRLLT
jgi:hypothetical protein